MDLAPETTGRLAERNERSYLLRLDPCCDWINRLSVTDTDSLIGIVAPEVKEFAIDLPNVFHHKVGDASNCRQEFFRITLRRVDGVGSSSDQGISVKSLSLFPPIAGAKFTWKRCMKSHGSVVIEEM
jgi:hypothetical protein